MKKFLLKFLGFCVIVSSILYITLTYYGGYVDYFYNKFVTPKCNSIILGDSRSFQGIQPNEINTYFKGTNLELPILNYSFTLKQIAYGKPYNESILKKLDPNTKNGLFIITVHPYTLSNRNGGNNEEEDGIFFESNMPPHNMDNVSTNPNLEYLIKNFNYFHFRGIFRQSSKTHKNGWLEEKNFPSDTTILTQWKNGQISLYSRYAKEWKKSEERMRYLERLIKSLKEYGNVILLRLPIDEELLGIENGYWENFNSDMTTFSEKYKVPYINYCTKYNKFKTYDGIHLDKFRGVPFTKSLCDSINKHFHIKGNDY